MPTLTIKKVPSGLAKRLKRSAALHRRSVNSEVISCLERMLMSRGVDPEEFLARVRAHRPPKSRILVTDQDLRAAKNWGRL